MVREHFLVRFLLSGAHLWWRPSSCLFEQRETLVVLGWKKQQIHLIFSVPYLVLCIQTKNVEEYDEEADMMLRPTSTNIISQTGISAIHIYTYIYISMFYESIIIPSTCWCMRVLLHVAICTSYYE
jgi:hypothetical protein